MRPPLTLNRATRAAAKSARRVRLAETAASRVTKNVTRAKAAPATDRSDPLHFLTILSVAIVPPAFVAADPFSLLESVTYANTALSIVATGETFTCTPTSVWDGDGPIWCAEGPRIRIAGVAAREMDGSCRPGHPCPSVSAIDARDRLVQLLGGSKGRHSTGHVIVRSEPMQCVSEGSARGTRTAAWCHAPAFGDLSCAVVRAGGAVRWDRYWRDHRC